MAIPPFQLYADLFLSAASRRFMDAYQKGLTGKQVVWGSNKYRGHRVLPNSIFAELEKAGL
ncbi:hypothetical protein F4604DRAFT_1583319 [Suillus subluteus]|nr:hypothetical protein F4604DRAFT_1583319 [Suillus subluteus]